jgi:hypothetical protein
MVIQRFFIVGAATLFALQAGLAQVPSPGDSTQISPAAQLNAALQQIERLANQVAAQEVRIRDLEAGGNGSAPSKAAGSAVVAQTPEPSSVPPEPRPQADLASVPEPKQVAVADADAGGHQMAIPGGPVLNIRGFFDFNFGVGSIANPLVFPIVSDGCGTCGNPLTPPHTSFQAGEFDLFMTSKLSDHLSFLAEIVLGPDSTNVFGPDIERYSLTYRANRYFSASAGRFHTSIGYYNTAYHHGNWFSTAEGRPIMYLFEDSGGILPVHMVGLSFTGQVPNTDQIGLHWVAEVGNGLSSNSTVAESVQNFYSDRNYKATNLAVYIKPQFLPGIQIGGSWYHDGLNPAGVPEVRQNIESAYVVYFSSDWEFLTEAVLLSNHLEGTGESFRSPMAYTQLARKFGIYRPYFRYQYVNDKYNDPVNLLQGRYYGPSVGVRVDFAEYAAFKLQFNHLYESRQLAGNGLDAQIAFTF